MGESQCAAGQTVLKSHSWQNAPLRAPLNMCSPAAVTRTLRLTVHHGQTLSVTLDGFVSGGRRFKSGASRHVGQHFQTTIETAPEKYKTIDDLHGPSLATTVYWLFVKGYADKSHAMQVKLIPQCLAQFLLLSHPSMASCVRVGSARNRGN